MKKTIGRLLLFFALLPLCMTAGCGTEKEEYTKTGDVEFTVVEEADIPKELLDAINGKKAEPFKLTYLAEDETMGISRIIRLIPLGSGQRKIRRNFRRILDAPA